MVNKREKARNLRQAMAFVECGSCGMFHPADFCGDCRDDNNRFDLGEIEADEHNTPDNIEREIIWVEN